MSVKKKLEAGSWNPDVTRHKAGTKKKSGLRRLEDGRNKVSLRDGSFKWIPAVAGMTGWRGIWGNGFLLAQE